MASSFPAILLLLFAASLPVTTATCSDDNNACEPFSGNCSQPLLSALGPDPLDVFRNFRYGKYCGRQTCRPVDTEVNGAYECIAGTTNCPVAPCDDIDSACQEHDYCLERELNALGLGVDALGGVPIPRRCRCESEFVSSLMQVRTNGELCDAGYYTFPFPDPKDANLFAAIPCCVLLLQKDDGERYCESDARQQNYYDDLYAPAASQCDRLLATVSTVLNELDVCAIVVPVYAIDEPEVVPESTEKCTIRRNRAV